MLSKEECKAKINIVSFGPVLFQIVIDRPALRRTDESEEMAESAGFVPQFVFRQSNQDCQQIRKTDLDSFISLEH
jgi:hypothetical protein